MKLTRDDVNPAELSIKNVLADLENPVAGFHVQIDGALLVVDEADRDNFRAEFLRLVLEGKKNWTIDESKSGFFGAHRLDLSGYPTVSKYLNLVDLCKGENTVFHWVDFPPVTFNSGPNY